MNRADQFLRDLIETFAQSQRAFADDRPDDAMRVWDALSHRYGHAGNPCSCGRDCPDGCD